MTSNDILFSSKNLGTKEIIFNDDLPLLDIIESAYDIVFNTLDQQNNNNNIYFNGAEKLSNPPPTFGVLGLKVAKPPTLRLKGTVTSNPVTGVLKLKNYEKNLKIVGYYNINNPLEWLVKKGQSLQNASNANLNSTHNFRNGLSSEKEINTNFEKSEYAGVETSTTLENSVHLGSVIGNSFEKAATFQYLVLYNTFQSSVVLNFFSRQATQRAELINSIIYRTSLQNGQEVYNLLDTSYQKSVPVEDVWKSFFNLSSVAIHNFVGKFEKAEELGNPKPVIVVIPPTEPTVNYDNNIVFKCLAKDWELNPYDYTIVFNDTCELRTDQPTDYSEPIFVKNTFTLKNLETGQEIKANDLSFSTDVDSYAWTGSMTIPDNQVGFLKSPTNKAVLIEYVFNGIKAVFQVGKLSRNITFGQRSYKVKLSSPTIKLDEPISNVTSYTNQNTLTPSAYAEKLIDPINSGITLIWDFLSPLEWAISKGAFTYQNLSPIKAIGSMLENSGAFISTSLDGKNLVVKRKRPVVFWGETDLSKLITIPTGVITSLGYEIEHLQHFTGVYVLADDRTVFVRRRGTNGAILAPQIVANQLTSNQACVEAGRYVLANSGIVEAHDLAKPILNDTVLLNPADIVKFVLDDVTYIGTVISTSVAIKFNSQYQTFKVEVIKGFN